MYSFTQAALNMDKNKAKGTPFQKNRVYLTVERRLDPGPRSMSRTFGLSPQDEARLRNLSLEELAAGGMVLEVWSEVVGETILLVPDTYTPSPEDPVTYTHAEMKVLMDADEDLVKDAHQIKKTFKARVLSAEKIEETP
jgi:hypothetical protein